MPNNPQTIHEPRLSINGIDAYCGHRWCAVALRRYGPAATIRGQDAARLGVLAVGFGGFNETVELSAGGCAFWRVAERPVLAVMQQRWW